MGAVTPPPSIGLFFGGTYPVGLGFAELCPAEYGCDVSVDTPAIFHSGEEYHILPIAVLTAIGRAGVLLDGPEDLPPHEISCEVFPHLADVLCQIGGYYRGPNISRTILGHGNLEPIITERGDISYHLSFNTLFCFEDDLRSGLSPAVYVDIAYCDDVCICHNFGLLSQTCFRMAR